MGFLDKIKNMFTEEVEEDEVKVEKIKKEVTKVAIESPKAVKEEIEEDTQEFKFEYKEPENKPVFFDDNDFRDLNITPKVEEKKIVKKEPELYSNRITLEKTVPEKKMFKPTPIISPVYGVLDKNYHKEDIVSRTEKPRVIESIEEPSIESIRNKAYGTLEDELENTLFGTNSILFKKDTEEDSEVHIEEISDEALTTLTDDISKELDELLIDKVKYSDSNIDNNKNLDDDNLLDFIDSTLYKTGDE